MAFPLFIAWRYLFSHKRLNAVNIVSAISAVAVGIVSMALVCVLSIFNGYEELIMQQSSLLDPDLRIERAEGNTFSIHTPGIPEGLKTSGIAAYSQRLAAQGLVRTKYGEQATGLIGYDSLWHNVVDLKNAITEGSLTQRTPDGQKALASGFELALLLNTGVDFADPVHIYVPNRLGMINPLAPMSAFRYTCGYITATLEGDRNNYDVSNSLFMPVEDLQNLLGYESGEINSIEIRVAENERPEQVQKKLQKVLGKEFAVLTQTEQHPEIKRLVYVEKWMSFLILIFILLLAAFNIISSLSMLLIEKKQDADTMASMGATPRQIKRIFIVEGTLISMLGAAGGILLGILICLIQQKYGIITYSIGMVSVPYPVRIEAVDMLICGGTIILLSLISAFYPVHFFGRHWHR
ncbi:hypothetical protein HR11_00405 [Porphyromonas macacae]|uniref:FtsX-like permease family protein n=1 Tax=Porphyromonas macacae TaxID=28115 RepID=UPI00052C7E1B|nr:FtsX-like permease family protein [Porphyromonas macacae]KGO00386.1 hypothetical protein HR11_00405 [Porphyromonas macacae]